MFYILFYIGSLVGCWFTIRYYENNIIQTLDVTFIEVFFCLCPIINTVAFVVYLLEDIKHNIKFKFNWNKFFMIKK